ncbi:MAG: Unknown protein [uncultured Sulfurovum sp.]|uniref:Translocation and assembly module TamB C-terminal domain-containing protein n=1 Tax=uncultured Sulfurovum sp. TaxID=269237 RepID=A0A6S6SM73_9BACT|nr:MAG: Unknown protein [uncultured Sulfurovum sp.]
MIRFIYWTLALIEVLLVLAALLLFIITDSRTIKYIAETSLDSSDLAYESIQGNLFNGLEINKLSYKNKPLFSSALIYWNPLTLFYDKVTITKLDAKGIELEHIMRMMNDLKSESSGESSALDFGLAINSSYFDINPYIYEGLKFSSFTLETGKIEVSKDLEVNTDTLYLKFDSDIVNVTLDGKIDDSSLFVNNLDLKNISANDITKLTRRLKSKYKKDKSTTKKENSKSNFLKEIKVKHILGTMKPVQYGDLKIKGATLHLYNGTIDPNDNFKYQVKKLDFNGKTNFGKLLYKGEVKDSTIYAKGNIVLDKALFSKYTLPLNFKGLEKLPSKLRLNHSAVWIDIDHKVEKLLKLKSDFNLDVSEGKHNLHYNYSKGDFTIKSDLLGAMTYADNFAIQNNVLINKKGFSYEGEVQVKQVKALPKIVSEYLLPSVEGKFKGGSNNFDMNLDSKLLSGKFSMPAYKNGLLELNSKEKNIALNEFIPNLPIALRNEKVAFSSQSFFNFKNLQKSNIDLKIINNTVDVDGQMTLEMPYNISLQSRIKDDRLLNEIEPKVKFTKLQRLNGDILFNENSYLINLQNQFLKFRMKYDSDSSSIRDIVLNLEGEEFNIQRDHNKALAFNSNIANIQKFLEKMQSYYDFEIPNIRGEANIFVKKQKNGIVTVNVKSPKLQYLSDEGVNLTVTNFYNVELAFTVDEASNIVINNYQFKIDDNGYMNAFYSTKKSYLSLKKGQLHMSEFWLNDKIKLLGNYDTDTSKGRFEVDSSSYTLKTKDFALILDLDLVVKIDSNKFDIEGDIDILGDIITYEVVGTNIVEDSDIIILKDMLNTKESVFNNFKLYVKVNSKGPLKYITDDINIEFLNKLSIVKNYHQDMMVTGTSNIESGYYRLEDKKFVLDKSNVYFTGDIKTPLLDIKASYEKDQYNVYVFISGTTDAPIVNFNSDPYLTQQEILSLILFDGTGSSSGNGAEAYTLLGGSFAKGLIKSLGIDVDHLLLGTDADEQLSLEVGKRISKDISVLYLHKNGLDGAKVRIEHSKNFETDIIIQPPNTSSIEFLYKQDR